MTINKGRRSAKSGTKKAMPYEPSTRSCVKVAISMPSADLACVEKARKQLKLSHSKLMLLVVRNWFEEAKQRLLVEKYIEGYENLPEEITITKALVAAQTEVLDKEGWKPGFAYSQILSGKKR